MKLKHIALVCAMAVTGQAQALSPTEIADPSVIKIYMSGATALRNTIGGLFLQNCSSDVSVYFSAASTTFSGIAFNVAGDAHRAYACTLKATSPFLAGKKVAFYKSDIGGSGQGVFPVYFGAISPFPTRKFLNLTTTGCSPRAATAPNYTCSTEFDAVPMFGVSDVEPGLFRGINVPGDDPNYPLGGLSDSQLADLDIGPVFQTVFGVAANVALRNAMQAKQGLTVGSEAEADRPSISKIELASYISGTLSDPSSGLGWQPIVLATDPKKDTRVNICRRVNGSGTQASANAFINTFPCNGAAVSPIDNSFSDEGLMNAVSSVGPNGNIFVFEGSTTGNVISCITAAQTTGAYAIGHVSKENNEVGTQWRHLRVDGIAPSRDNVKNGKYDYFFESTIQWHRAKFATLTPDQQELLTVFRAQAQKPDSLAQLSTSNQLGVAALPSAYPGAFGTGTANEINFGSRVTRDGDSCKVPFFAK